jgi:subfamily B ATP-binding cassette protein MsbA
MNAVRTRSIPSLPLIRRLVSTYLRPYGRSLAGAVFCMIVAAGMTALFAKLIQPVMDDVFVQNGAGGGWSIWGLGLTIFVCFIVRGLASYGQALQMARIGQWIIRDIQNDLFRHLVRLDLAFFHENPSGQLASRLVGDTNVMRMAVTDALAGIGSACLTLVLLCGVMIYQDWQLALIALAVMPIASFLVAVIGKRLRNISRSIQDQSARLNDRFSEVFGAIRQVQAYGMETSEGTRAAVDIDHVRRLNVKSIRIGQLLVPFNEVLVGLTIFAIILYGGGKIADGATTPGALMSFIAAFALAYEPVKRLGKYNNVLQVGLGAAERVLALIDTQAVIKDAPNAVPLRLTAAPTIQFQDVSFRYASGETALDHLELLIPAGKTTALVGTSGGGKTTLINMLLRFYDPQSGAVLINGTDIRLSSLSGLRGMMALVSQDIIIFNTTIRDNIAYGTEHATMEELTAAARAASAHDFISALPNGYDTVVGENGVLLSGGQRQRLAIARAILRNAPILLLDEATSALDNYSEQQVQESLDRLAQGRTTIVIAHRLSTIRHADQIVVMENGRVTEAERMMI